jgi:hypothetical protein
MAGAHPDLRDLRITANPARDLVTIEGANNARNRALSLAELRAYWNNALSRCRARQARPCGF